MARLRVEQRKDESPDLFAMRAFALALPQMDLKETTAFAKWIWERSSSEYEKKRASEEASRLKTVDGLAIVEWIKKRRIDTGCSLVEAKNDWDARIAAQ